MRNHKHLAALLACAVPVIAASAVTPVTQADQRLTLEQLYPEKSLLGRGASGMRWSNDGSQLIYQWSPYQAGLKTSVGADIYLYKRSSGKTTRLTSPEMFASVDRDIAKVIEQLAEEQKVLESRKGLTEKEQKVLEDADKEKEKARKEPRKSYPGVSEAVLSDSGNELLLTYKGDIYRLALSPDAKPVRLTRTADVEADVRWTPGDKGFTFRRGEHIYRRIFGDVIEAQISPVLPDGLKVEQYWLSKDGSRIGVLSSKRTGPPAKNVSYIVYRDRFAEAKTTPRDTGDDPDRNESYVFVADTDPDTDITKSDGKPWQVYKKNAGEAGDIAISNEPFTADGKKFVFTAWKRDKKESSLH